MRERSEIIFYVAPTRKLLAQVREDLKQRLPEADHVRLQTFVSRNYERHTAIAPRLFAALDGRPDPQGRKYPAIVPGCVIFLAHEGFLDLASIPRQKSITVLFDEARKLVHKLEETDLSPTEHKVFYQCFSLEEVEGTRFRKVVDVNANKAQLAQIRSSSNLLAILERVRNPRLELYVLQHEKDQRHYRFFQVIMPSRIFAGFKKVFVMSAFFEDSQMYHLLKQCSSEVRLNDCTYEIEDYSRRKRKILHRYARVQIVPLTLQKTVISKTQLNGVLVSDLDLAEIHAKVDEAGLKSNRLRDILYKLRGEADFLLEEHEKPILEFLKQRNVVMNPLQWYIDKAEIVVKRWLKVNPDEAQSDKPALLILNKDIESNVSIPDVFRPLTTSLNGINAYKGQHVVVFLAAVNPDNHEATFLRKFLPSYTHLKDFVIDSCMQCVSRVSIRDTDSKNDVLIIVPDRTIAKLLSERMDDLPGIDNVWAKRFGEMMALYTNESKSRLAERRRKERLRQAKEKRAQAQLERAALQQKKNQAAPRLATLEPQLSKLRKLILSDPNHRFIERRKAKAADLARQVKQLRQLRAEVTI